LSSAGSKKLSFSPGSDAVMAADGAVDGRVLFAIDEAVLLGPLAALQVARDQGRKYRITLQLFYQSEGQVEEVWGRPGRESWFDGVSWRAYGGVQSLATAKDLSAALGTYGAVAVSRGSNSGTSARGLELGSRSRGANVNEHEIGRELAKPFEVLQEVARDERIVLVPGWGSRVLSPDGHLDRPALRALVFEHPEELEALNAIVHPEVRRRYDELVAEAFARDPDAIVVYDVPLLAEARAASDFGLVIVVDAPADVRLERLVALRGMDREQARARIAAQISDEESRAMADVVIYSSGTIAHTMEQVDALWERLVAQRSVGGRS